MRTCSAKEIDFTTPIQPLNETEILNLVAELIKLWQGQLKIDHFEFNINNNCFYHYTCKHPDGRLAGHGRSRDPVTALCKSVYELLERQTMKRYFEDLASAPADEWSWQSGRWQWIAPSTITNPPRPFCTSNGWAAGTTAAMAAEAAWLEAIERHSLQLAYWQSGFMRLQRLGQLSVKEQKVDLYCMSSPFAGLDILIASTSSPHFKGLTFGHCALRAKSQYDLKDWEGAILESVQTAMICERPQVATSVFERIDRHFAQDEGLKAKLEREQGQLTPSPAQELRFQTRVTQLEYTVPVYVAQVTSTQIFPLVISEDLKAEELAWLTDFGQLAGWKGPFFQTPFT